MFVDTEIVRQVQQELDQVINEGVSNIVDLLKKADNRQPGRPGTSSANMIDEDTLEAKRRRMKAVKGSWTHDDANMAKKETDRKKPVISADSDEEVDISIGQELDVNKPLKKFSGTLTSQLLQQGIVTKEQIKQLQRELKKQK